MALRLFAAIGLPEEVRDRLETLQRDIPGADWRPREAFHLTLRFFGAMDEARARDLDDELARIDAPMFEMQLKSAGSFGGAEPSALWAGVEAPPTDPRAGRGADRPGDRREGPLHRLNAACERAARRVGLAPEKRNFAPHVTLAYSRGLTAFDAALFNQRYAEFRTEPFWVDRFALFSSWPGKSGGRYVEEAVYPLRPPAGGASRPHAFGV